MGKYYSGSAKIDGPFDCASTATTVLYNRKRREKDSAYRNVTTMLVIINLLLLIWLVGAEIGSAAISRLMLPVGLGIWFVGLVFLSNIVLHIVTVAMGDIRRSLLIASLIHNAITWFMFPAVFGVAVWSMVEDSWGTEQQCQQFQSLKVISIFVPNWASLILSTMKCCMCGFATLTVATHIVLEIRYLYKSIEVSRQQKSAAASASYSATASGATGRRTGTSVGGSRTNISTQQTGGSRSNIATRPVKRLQLQEPARTASGLIAVGPTQHVQSPTFSPLKPMQPLEVATDSVVYENTAVAMQNSRNSLVDPRSGGAAVASPQPAPELQSHVQAAGVSLRATGYKSLVPGFVPGLNAAPPPPNARPAAGYRNGRPY